MFKAQQSGPKLEAKPEYQRRDIYFSQSSVTYFSRITAESGRLAKMFLYSRTEFLNWLNYVSPEQSFLSALLILPKNAG